MWKIQLVLGHVFWPGLFWGDISHNKWQYITCFLGDRNMTYCMSPGPDFYVDSGSEVRIPILCLCGIWYSHIVWIYMVDDWFSHRRCSNCYNCYPCCQEVVLYAQSMDQKSLYQITKYCLWWKPTSDTCLFWQYITYFEGIPSPIPSGIKCNTSYLMAIVNLKRVCYKILSMGKCTYRTLPETAQCADFSLILAICPW